MTDMVHGAVPSGAGEAILPRWWRTIDKISLGAVLALFAVGLLLGLAASVPLATRNNLPEFHYVERQAAFGLAGIVVMVVVSMFSPRAIRRVGVLGFGAALGALMLLPFFGTDFGKGAVRWFSFGFASVQPSEFLKPGFVVFCAWMMAASQDINGPPGKRVSALVAVLVVGLLAMQPDFGQAALVLFGWGVVYFVAGAPILLVAGVIGAVFGAGRSPIIPPSISRDGSTASSRPTSIRAPRSAMRRTPSSRAAFSAPAWARGRSSGNCPTRTPISSSRSRPRNTGLSSCLRSSRSMG